jgi:integrase
MGSIYRRTERYCQTCNGKRLARKADRTACTTAGHRIEERPSGTWWINFRDAQGKLWQEAAGKRQADARTLLKKREGDIAHGKPVPPKLGKLTFEEAASDLLTDYRTNQRRSLSVVQRRVEKHLTAFFGGRKMGDVTTSLVRRYIERRQTNDTVLVHKARPATPARWKRAMGGRPRVLMPAVPARAEVRRPASAAEINRELALLKRMFSLAIQAGTLLYKPYIPMLKENNVRTGFFEPQQYRAVLAHLPAEVRPIITFGYITGWRIASEVLSLQWRQVDFAAGEIRLDAGTTKNGDGRVFPFNKGDALDTLLRAQKAEHDRLKQAGHVVPWVFFRMVAEERGGEKKPRPIVSFGKAWKVAVKAAGCPGRIPHDLRRTAVRNLVRSGISETVAMRMTGHKTRSVFDRYDIVSGDDLREAARKLDVFQSAR